MLGIAWGYAISLVVARSAADRAKKAVQQKARELLRSPEKPNSSTVLAFGISGVEPVGDGGSTGSPTLSGTQASVQPPDCERPEDDPRICEVCMRRFPGKRFPFARCRRCGARPSWHHGRCCLWDREGRDVEGTPEETLGKGKGELLSSAVEDEIRTAGPRTHPRQHLLCPGCQSIDRQCDYECESCNIRYCVACLTEESRFRLCVWCDNGVAPPTPPRPDRISRLGSRPDAVLTAQTGSPLPSP